MRSGSVVRGVMLLGAAALATGCHTYRPVQSAPPGSVVRVHVPVTNPLAGPNAPPQSVAVEGDVLANGDTLVLATQTRREIGAFREFVQFDTLRLGPDQRMALELREFSTGKSIALGVAITAGAVGLATVAFGLGGGGEGEGPPGTVPPSPAVVINRSVVSTVLGLIGR